MEKNRRKKQHEKEFVRESSRRLLGRNLLKNSNLREYALLIELEMIRFDAEMADHIYLQRVQEHLASGRDSDVTVTPAFFVNDKRVQTDGGLANLFSMVKSEVAKLRSKNL